MRNSKEENDEENEKEEKEEPYSYWRVWRAAAALDPSTGGTSSLFSNGSTDYNSDSDSDSDRRNVNNKQCAEETKNEKCYKELAGECATILRQWGKRWAGNGSFQSILNKTSLLHEVEESVVAIEWLLEWLLESDTGNDNDTNDNEITVVDMCCGKGIFSMLLSYLAARDTAVCKPLKRVSRCIMVDKATSKQIN